MEYDQRKAFLGADFIYAKNWSALKTLTMAKLLVQIPWTVDTEKNGINQQRFILCIACPFVVI